MKHTLRVLLVPLSLAVACLAWPDAVRPASGQEGNPIQKLIVGSRKHYEWLHAHPELSGREERTAAHLARELRRLGFSVREKIGGHGLIALLKNGPGKTLALRAELDALPVLEQTGLPYASQAQSRLPSGERTPVAHACGHDLHMAAWLGAAEFFSRNRALWRGTLMLIAQPAEETLRGARAMIEAGLLRDFPRPDLVFAIHGHDQLPTGTVGFTEGPMGAAADSVSIVLHGKGGHGAYPQASVDPVVMASKLVLSLQTIVAREVSPLEPAVITVGSIHAGTKNNVIPDEARLELTVRAYTEESRSKMLASIERIAKAEALAMNAPRPPTLSVQPGASVLVSDPDMTRALVDQLRAREKELEIVELPKEMGSEDFAEYHRAGLRTVMLLVGTAAPDLIARAKHGGPAPSSQHSGFYAPAMPASLEVALRVHTRVGLAVLGR